MGGYRATGANDADGMNANLRGSYIPSEASNVSLGASGVAVPSWCYDTPMPYRCDTPGCCPIGTTGSAGAAPSWCLNTPAAYRQYTPQCVNAGNEDPPWCYDLPAVSRQATPACKSASGSTGSSGSTAISPNWCNNIPAASRKYVSSCVNAGDAA